ncbi:MAG: 2-hydroxycarboxylate transporter family protein [Lachnospiraceae bacterium]|nr:2-hydroxycarboxylate transporter family protein [Lachnospiraceae bacterium]
MKEKTTIYGIPIPYYLILFAAVLIAMRMDCLPGGMIGALLVLMVFGGLFNLIGEHLPIVRSYLGGGTVVCIFGAAACSYFNVFPFSVKDTVNAFINTAGFLNFFIAAIVVGSILSMDRNLLIHASYRFLPVAFVSIAAALLVLGGCGSLLGYGFKDSILFIGIPMMSGGVGAGVIPLSGMYAGAMQVDSAVIMSRLVPASTLGNVGAILMAALLAKAGDKWPKLSGNGALMRNLEQMEVTEKNTQWDIQLMGLGMLLSFVYFLAGNVLNRLVPSIHSFAWMILLTGITKAAGIVPETFEHASWQWSRFMLKNWTNAVLIGIGISLIDLEAVMQALTLQYLILILVPVVTVSVVAAIGGWLVGFYPVESAVTAGLCTTNMGGTGNIAVLSSAKRMGLLPFAQLCTRICGSVVLVAASILVKVW